MSDIAAESGSRTPWHLWLVGVVATLWNSGGALDFTMTQTRADWYMGEFTAEQLDYFYGFPLWADIVWAMGVWGAFIGSILLLLRNRWAPVSFWISLAGLAGSSIYQFTAEAPEGLSSMGYNIFMGAIWLSVIFLIWYSTHMRAKGVLS